MSRKPFLHVLVMALAAVLALSACASRGGDAPIAEEPRDSSVQPGFYGDETSAQPTSGGTLTLADYAESRSLDPARSFPTGYSGGTPLVAVYDQLIRWNERDQDFDPRLAEAVEPNDDYTEWTIHLRPGVNFSDGTPLDADAVLGSFDYYFANHGADLGLLGPMWGGAEKIDDRTVKIALLEPWATFPFILGTGLGFIAAPAAIAGGPDAFQPIGAGAFTFESYKPSEELVLAKNPNYWDGEPHLDKLRFVWLGSDVAKYESFETEAVNAAVLRDPKTIHTAMDAAAPGWVRFESLGNMIQINNAEGRPGSDASVRRAIAHAIDQEALYDRAFDGHGAPTRHLFGPQSHWYNPDAVVREHDVNQARELVEQAKAEGFDGTLIILSNADPASRDQAMTIQAQLEAAGFTVENDFVRTVADFTTRIYVDGDFDFARSALAVSESDPYGRMFENYYSTAVTNKSSYASPEMDALIVELRATEGEDRRDVLQRIENLFLEDVPTVNLGSSTAFVIWSDNVYGIQPTNEAMLGFEKAWIGAN